ncbi:hypothetical protein BU17DRAFT_81085 [Hysterangium stoloniferum]|nr:hypothetical protein BU17DRAFT_81085 [Hysterangium stoloniferum]
MAPSHGLCGPVSFHNRQPRPSSVSFYPEVPINDEDEIEQDQEEASNENMVDMLSILQELQKSKSSKSTSRTIMAFEAKKQSIRDVRNEQIRSMKSEGIKYIEHVKGRMQELREYEIAAESKCVELGPLFEARADCIEFQINITAGFLSQLSPARLELVEADSADLRSHTVNLERVGKKFPSMRPSHQLATAAQLYIKHFKQLVQD